MNREGGPESRRGLRLGAAELNAALAGNVHARRELMLKLIPVVQARVARILVRTRPASGVAPRQELQDVMQEVFVALFEDDAHALRAWDESRGLSLANFVGLVAERQTVSILRSGKRSPFRETPSELEELDRALDPEQGPEPSALSRDLPGEARRTLARDALAERLGPLLSTVRRRRERRSSRERHRPQHRRPLCMAQSACKASSCAGGGARARQLVDVSCEPSPAYSITKKWTP